MFTFEDLRKLDDRSLQVLFRDIERDTLAIAMKNASEDLRSRVFANMSERAAKMLQEDLESKGPLRLSEVESAQREILATAQKLDREGAIILRGGEDDEVLE